MEENTQTQMVDIDHMAMALEEAKIAAGEDEVPVGCLIVLDGEILAAAHNRKEGMQDPTGHAEIIAIREATKKLGTWHLDDCVMYVTLEPCIMCTGAIIQSRIAKIVFGAADPKGGALISNLKLHDIQGLNHYPEIVPFVLEEESSRVLKDYFKAKRQK